MTRENAITLLVCGAALVAGGLLHSKQKGAAIDMFTAPFLDVVLVAIGTGVIVGVNVVTVFGWIE